MSGSVRSVACGSRTARAGRMVARNHQPPRLRKAGVEREVFRHRVQQRAEAQLPAPVADAVDDLAARRDHDLEARQRIALGEFPQRDTEARIRRRRQRERQRRQRARLDLCDIGERLALSSMTVSARSSRMPASVSCGGLPRRSSTAPSRCSRLAIAWLTADCDRSSRSAARLKPPASTTA